MPRPVVFDGQRLPASYANFYIANGLVLVPTFNDPADRVALDILADLFPGREVVGIHAVDLVWGLGTLHCMTRSSPPASRTRSQRRTPIAAQSSPVERPPGGGEGVDPPLDLGVVHQRRGVVGLDPGVDHERARAAPVLLVRRTRRRRRCRPPGSSA